MLKSYMWMGGWMEISGILYSKSTCGANNKQWIYLHAQLKLLAGAQLALL